MKIFAHIDRDNLKFIGAIKMDSVMINTINAVALLIPATKKSNTNTKILTTTTII